MGFHHYIAQKKENRLGLGLDFTLLFRQLLFRSYGQDADTGNAKEMNE